MAASRIPVKCLGVGCTRIYGSTSQRGNSLFDNVIQAVGGSWFKCCVWAIKRSHLGAKRIPGGRLRPRSIAGSKSKRPCSTVHDGGQKPQEPPGSPGRATLSVCVSD